MKPLIKYIKEHLKEAELQMDATNDPEIFQYWQGKRTAYKEILVVIKKKTKKVSKGR